MTVPGEPGGPTTFVVAGPVPERFLLSLVILSVSASPCHTLKSLTLSDARVLYNISPWVEPYRHAAVASCAPGHVGVDDADLYFVDRVNLYITYNQVLHYGSPVKPYPWRLPLHLYIRETIRMGLFGNKEKNELIKAAKGGDVQAQIKLAECYAWKNDIIQELSLDDAEIWYKKAMAQGSAEAMSKYAYSMQSYGRISVDDAIRLQEEAFSKGYADAADNLGDIYLDGELPRYYNETKATYWYMRGSEAGSALADHDYAYSLLKARGVEKDIDKSEALLIRAIQNGEERRQKYSYFYLGLISRERGNGVEAIERLKKAAELGVEDLEYMIGMEYALIGDNENALVYFRKGADRGDTNCMSMIMKFQ